MARNRGGSSSSSSRKPAAAAHPPPPPPMHHAPPPPPATVGGGGMGSGIMGTLAQGMAFGAGSEVAHQAVRSFMGGSSGGHHDAPQQQAAAPQQPQAVSQSSQVGGACQVRQQDLYKCLQEQNGNASACQFYFDALKQCQEQGF